MTLSIMEKMAMRMYDSYCEAVGGKAWNGQPCVLVLPVEDWKK